MLLCFDASYVACSGGDGRSGELLEATERMAAGQVFQHVPESSMQQDGMSEAAYRYSQTVPVDAALRTASHHDDMLHNSLCESASILSVLMQQPVLSALRLNLVHTCPSGVVCQMASYWQPTWRSTR